MRSGECSASDARKHPHTTFTVGVGHRYCAERHHTPLYSEAAHVGQAVVCSAGERHDETERRRSVDENVRPRLRRPDKMRVVDRAFRSLEEAILTGEMVPGTRLIEQTLAENLDVSRTTVREALLMLERRGLVESTPRGGTFVTRLSSSAAWDLCKMRALLEGYAIRTGFVTYDDNFFADLRHITVGIRACALPGDMPRLIQLDLEFHQLIVTRARSPHLRDLWAVLNGEIRALYLVTMERMTILPPHIAMTHEALINDLASGDLERAQRGMLHHYLDDWPSTQDDATEMRRILGLLTLEGDWQARVERGAKRSS